MTTTGYINDVAIGWQAKKINTNIRTAKSETPGKYGCALDTFREGGLDITLDIIAMSRTERNNIVASFMSEGVSTLKLGGIDVGYHYSGVCGDRSTDLQLSELVETELYPLSFLFETIDPFMYSDAVKIRGTDISTSGTQFSTDSAYGFNMAQNWNFANWSAGTSGVAPDNFTLGNNTGGISRSSTAYVGSYSCLMKNYVGRDTNYAVCYLTQPYVLTADTLYTFAVAVKIENYDAGELVLKVFDNGSEVASTSKASNTDWTWLTVTHTFTSFPVNPYIAVYLTGTPSVNSNFYVDAIIVTETANFSNTLSNGLTTSGTVFAVPDIQVDGIGVGQSVIPNPSPQTDSGTDNYEQTDHGVWHVVKTYTIAASPAVATLLTAVRGEWYSEDSDYHTYGYISVQGVGYNSGNETIIAGNTSSFHASSSSPKVISSSSQIQFSTNQAVSVRWYLKNDSSTSASHAHCKNWSLGWTGGTSTVNVFPSNVELFNTSDPFTKLQICNNLVPGESIRCNADGTGFFRYSDDYDTSIYSLIITASSDVTYDGTNKKITIAAGGYITYTFDCNFPIVAIPYSVMYIESGIPNIQIASFSGLGSGTFYDNDDNTQSSVTNANYLADLDNETNCRLAGATRFSVKIYPYSGSLVISSVYFYADIAPIDVEHPVILTGASNTFQVDMDNDAQFRLSMSYNDREWGI